jgi:hypothetical protein
MFAQLSRLQNGDAAQWGAGHVGLRRENLFRPDLSGHVVGGSLMLQRILAALAIVAWGAAASANAQAPADVAGKQHASGKLSPAALETLVAGIALYPDPVVEQALDAAGCPAALHQAAISLKVDPKAAALVAQLQANWPQSVRILRTHPELLLQLDRQLALTTRLGNAYKTQPKEVWAAIHAVRTRNELAARE